MLADDPRPDARPRMMGLAWSPFVTTLAGPQSAWPHVKATLLQIAQTYTANPAWQQQVNVSQQLAHEATMESLATGSRILQMQAQSGMEAIAAHAQRARMSARSAAEVDALQTQGWQAAQASRDEQRRRAVNAVRETVDLVDPETGRVYRGAPAGFATWWTDGADRVVGTQGHDNPDPSRLRQAADLDDLRGRKPPSGR